MRTSLISTIGGPDAISDAFVPGLILLKAPSSILKPSPSCGLLFESPIVGLFGPICTSVKGGGDGSRGELEGDTPPRPDPVVMSTSGKQRHNTFRVAYVYTAAVEHRLGGQSVIVSLDSETSTRLVDFPDTSSCH